MAAVHADRAYVGRLMNRKVFRDPRRNKRLLYVFDREARKRGWRVGSYWPTDINRDSVSIVIAPRYGRGVVDSQIFSVSGLAMLQYPSPRALAIDCAKHLPEPA